MFHHPDRISFRTIFVGALLISLLVVASSVLAQDGVYVPGQHDGRINTDVYMGGANVYCVNQFRAASDSYARGGILVLDPQGNELLYVPEATIAAGFDHVASTGQYATLGTSERLWYGGQRIALYILTSNEFQINAFDDQGKLVEFQWNECRVVPKQTSDGCLPGWDRDEYNNCVYRNLY